MIIVVVRGYGEQRGLRKSPDEGPMVIREDELGS
jgi:hypothetical protein